MRRTAATLAITALLVGSACSSDPEPEVGDGPTTSSLDDGSGETAAPDATEEVDGPDDQAGTGTPMTPDQDETEPAPAETQTEAAPAPTTSTSREDAGANGGEPGPAADDGGLPDPLPVGTWTYDTDGETQFGSNPPQDMPARTTLEARPANGNDVQTTIRDYRDEDGEGNVTDLTVQYSENGVVIQQIVTSTTVDVGLGSPVTQTSTLEATPPSVIAPPDPQPGFATTFRLEGDGIEVDGSLEILRRETLTIGGESVEVLVVDLVFDYSGEVDGRQTATWWVRPDDLLIVREESQMQATSGGFQFRQQQTSQLRSLQPA